jgi:hypothetical protein
MRRHRSSAMRSGIAVVALPRLDEKSLSRASDRPASNSSNRMKPFDATTGPCPGRVIMNNPG